MQHVSMRLQRLGACLAVAAAACGAVRAQQPITASTPYTGMCDASAAAAIGRGHFVVANDEDNVLRVYKRGQPQAVSELPLSAYLKTIESNGDDGEADIEGAATVGQRIYWIASHARKGKNGKVDPRRWRLFATDISAPTGTAGAVPTLQPAGKPYTDLLKALADDDTRFAPLNAAAKAELSPEQAGGFNIEGLAATPAGGLLIGFRNPLLQGRALVLPLNNPAQLLQGADGTGPALGNLVALDLGGRGIRSLERVGDGYLVVAGPVATAADSPVQPAFALFRWDGTAAQQPVFVRGLDAGSFRPEAMFADADANELVLLSDDGDEPVGNRDCKDKQVPAAQKSFRASALPLPAPVSLSALQQAAAPPCTVERTATFAGETLRLARRDGMAANAGIALYKAPLAVNTDGAPTSYHPGDFKGERLAINRIDNGIVIAANDGSAMTTARRIEVFDRWRASGASGNWAVPSGFRITWKNVIAADGSGNPCVFKQGPNAGYFGSLTRLNNGLPAAAAGECGALNQLDQRSIPALVLRGTSNPLRGWGVAVGDLALAINPATGAMVPAVIGDSGDDKRIGEASVALNMALLTGSSMPRTYKEALALDTGTRDMVVAVLPASQLFQRQRPYTPANIAQRVQAWAVERGYGSVQELGAVALACARPL